MDINKLFLANTIRSVESHNKREEEADCWRQHEMIRKSSDLRRRRRHDDDSRSQDRRQPAHINVNDERLSEEREHWALKKARVLNAAEQSEQIIQAFCEANLSSGVTGKNNEADESNKKKTKKKKKDKKKKEKKKKDKKEKYS